MYNRGRRCSLPTQSLADGASHRSSYRQRRKKKEKKIPCIELLPAYTGDKDKDTPTELKEFMKDIEPEDSDDEERFYKGLPFNERVRLRNQALYGSNCSINSDLAKHLISNSTSSSRRGSLKVPSRRGSSSSSPTPDKMDEMTLDEDEYQEFLENEKKVTKFTEMEIVALWNQFKLNFPHGTVSKPQLTELLQKVIIVSSEHS